MEHGNSSPFSESEIQALHAQDVAAGRAVVVLMSCIFLLGIVIYSIVVATIIL